VLILKEVKVVCFDTLLQVLILKNMEGLSGTTEKRDEVGSPSRMVSTLQGGTPTPGVLQKEAGFA
jgi:hypothetical protein